MEDAKKIEKRRNVSLTLVIKSMGEAKHSTGQELSGGNGNHQKYGEGGGGETFRKL